MSNVFTVPKLVVNCENQQKHFGLNTITGGLRAESALNIRGVLDYKTILTLASCFQPLTMMVTIMTTSINVILFSSYLPQLLVFLQSHHLGRVGDLDFVVFTGGDSGLGGLDRALQVGPPYAVHAPETRKQHDV